MLATNFETTLKQRCSACSLREICLPLGLDQRELSRLDDLIKKRRAIPAGQHLFRAGDPFQGLAAVRSGFFKIYEISESGYEQITGFPMGGELIGLDAISTGAHLGNALALEDSEVCEIPFARLEILLSELPRLQHQFHKLLSGAIVLDHSLLMVLGTMTAEHKLAAFLLNLADRLEMRGYSPLVIHLPMSREEIGNYLGLKLETVSRMFSKLRQEGLIEAEGRKVLIRKRDALKTLAAGARRDR
ncbi:MAG: fumarate/nitrate reduction transcriptional regulator Fnr [Gammaproteobacteria bacterium]|nr:fumarate/nitrate reduction transcriptional regulator Fnr [Gammaproteobacteria bacterium]